MLHKRHNSVITLALLLTLVGISKPAKAFLLAQSDSAPTTFEVPDQLPADTTVNIATSKSTASINTSLEESFTKQYPQAEVKIETQDSAGALQALADGQADLAAIGRDLTAEEKAQGFVSIPISREKIAIVVSPENSYDGNLTIEQFAQIFRGEITDWSEIDGTAGAIELVDLPDSNDTRSAFPNYPVFESAEFATGETANQLQQDSTDAMIAALGENGIGYAVANDVINRDDVKIVTMHQTLPGDPRYPFSQPFNLIYQETPSEAAQAYLGFASTENGQKVIENKVGSLALDTVTAIAPGVGAGLANQNGGNSATDATPDADIDEPDNEAIADADIDAEVDVDETDSEAIAGADVDAEVDVDIDETDSEAIADADLDADADVDIDEPDSEAIAGADIDADADVDIDETDSEAIAGADVDAEVDVDETDSEAIAGADVDAEVDVDETDSEAIAGTDEDVVANADADVDGSGEINPDVAGSGEINPDVDGSGEINPDVDGSGEINPDVDGSGEINSDVDGSGEINPDVADSGDPVSSAVDGVDGEAVLPNATDEAPEGTAAVPRDNRWWLWLLPLLAIPVLGAFLLGGRKKGDQEPAVDNVPPNVNSSGGGMSVPGMSTNRSTPPVGANVSGNLGNVAGNTSAKASKLGVAGLAAGGAALAGGAAANLAGRRNRTESVEADLDLDLDFNTPASLEEIPSNPVDEFTEQETKLQTGDDLNLDSGNIAAGFGQDTEQVIETNPDVANLNLDPKVNDFSTEQTTDLVQPNLENKAETVSEEFRGDFVLHEETETISSPVDLNPGDVEAVSGSVTTPNLNVPDVDLPEVNVPDLNVPNVDLPNVESPTAQGGTGILDGINQAGGAAIAGGAAALGGAAAAASGIFNRGQDGATDVPESSQDTDLDLNIGNLPNNLDIPDVNIPDVELPNVEGSTDINVPELNVPNVDLPDVNVPQVNIPDVDLPNVEGSTGINVPELNVPNVDLPDVNVPQVNIPDVDLPNVESPTAQGGTGILDGINQAGGAAIAGGAAALGGAAAAASGIFNRGQDGTTDVPESSQDTDLDLNIGNLPNNLDIPEVNVPDVDLPNVEGSTDINVPDVNLPEVNVPQVNIPDVDLPNVEGSTDINVPDVNLPEVNVPDLNVPDLNLPNVESPTAQGGTGILDGINQAGGAAIAGGAAALGGAAAAASGMFNADAKSTDDLQEFETFETSFDLSDDSTPASFADNVIADAETISISDDDLSQMTLDDVTNQTDLNLEDIELDDTASNVNVSLEEITFDDVPETQDFSLEDIELDDTASNVDVSLEEITFDDGLTEVSNEEINIDDLGFEDTSKIQAVDSDPLSDNAAEITSLSDDESNDLNNISDWLDSLETPNKDTDNISDWLDTLDQENLSQTNETPDNISQARTSDLTRGADDISFQFLEDLLDRDEDNSQ